MNVSMVSIEKGEKNIEDRRMKENIFFIFYFIPIVLKKYLGKFNFLLFGHFHGRSNKDNNFLRTRIM